jgi:hypothetical protein
MATRNVASSVAAVVDPAEPDVSDSAAQAPSVNAATAANAIAAVLLAFRIISLLLLFSS